MSCALELQKENMIYTAEQIELALKMSVLTLADLEGKTQKQLFDEMREWGATSEELDGARVLVAYISVGDYGCDSAGYFLFTKDGNAWCDACQEDTAHRLTRHRPDYG